MHGVAQLETYFVYNVESLKRWFLILGSPVNYPSIHQSLIGIQIALSSSGKRPAVGCSSLSIGLFIFTRLYCFLFFCLTAWKKAEFPVGLLVCKCFHFWPCVS